MKTKKLLENLIRIDSQVTITNQQIIHYIYSEFEGYEREIYPFRYDGIKGENLIIRIRGENQNTPLIFVGHSDTVKICGKWNTPPFNPIENDGKIYGLGASDMKGGIACIISAAKSLDTIPKNDLYLIFDGAEENNSQGMRNLIKKLKFIKDARIIIPEPLGRNLTYAQKGYFDLGIVGLTGTQQEFLIEELSRLNYLLSKKEHELGIPIIKWNYQNKRIKIERILIPGEDIQLEWDTLIKKIRFFNKEVKIYNRFWNPPYDIPLDSKIITDIQKIEPDLIPSLKNAKGWTESQIMGSIGQAVVFGPGNYSICHKPNEFIEIEDLKFFTQKYINLMKNL